MSRRRTKLSRSSKTLKIYNPKLKEVKQSVIFLNADTSILKNGPEYRKNFFGLFASKRITNVLNNNLYMELKNKQDATDVHENRNPTFSGSKTAARQPATHATKYYPLMRQIDKSCAETDISQEFQSCYSIPKPDFDVRRFKTKEGKAHCENDFGQPDNSNKLLPDRIFLSKHFCRQEKFSAFIQVT